MRVDIEIKLEDEHVDINFGTVPLSFAWIVFHSFITGRSLTLRTPTVHLQANK